MNDNVYHHLLSTVEKRGAGFLLLIDPDSSSIENCVSATIAAKECGVDALLVGSSFVLESNFHKAVKEIKQVAEIPVIIFPGSYAQIAPHADAILFTSLLSGRNPAYLVDEQVKGAPLVKKNQIEPIPTGYLLIESGSTTSVQFVSDTQPIPRDKNEIACAHALAAQYLGMKFIYLEAGSGARYAVPTEMITNVSNYIDIPLIVGGGLKTAEDCRARVNAGASFLVVGNSFESNQNYDLLKELAAATHTKESIPV